MPYLLDTNHCIHLLNGWHKPQNQLSTKEANVIETFDAIENNGVFLSEVTLGELYYGAGLSAQKDKNIERIDILKTAIPPVPVEETIWLKFGETKAALQQQGTKIPDFDLLIAVSAQYHDLTIVTDDKHLLRLLPDSFKRENWLI